MPGEKLSTMKIWKEIFWKSKQIDQCTIYMHKCIRYKFSTDALEVLTILGSDGWLWVWVWFYNGWLYHCVDVEWPYLYILGSGGCDHIPETATFALRQRSMSIPLYSSLLLVCDPTPGSWPSLWIGNTEWLLYFNILDSDVFIDWVNDCTSLFWTLMGVTMPQGWCLTG